MRLSQHKYGSVREALRANGEKDRHGPEGKELVPKVCAGAGAAICEKKTPFRRKVKIVKLLSSPP